MHAPGKGISGSALPYRRSVPTWLKLTSEDVKEQIYKLAKKVREVFAFSHLTKSFQPSPSNYYFKYFVCCLPSKFCIPDMNGMN